MESGYDEVIVTVTLNAAIDKRYVVQQVQPHTVMRVADCSYTAGGKGLNVSRAARLCGAHVCATGFLGGFAGQYIAAELAREDIAQQFVSVQGESRSCINIVDLGGGSTELLEPGICVTGKDLAALRQTLSGLLNTAQLVVLSGSAPMGCPLDIYIDLVQLARSAGVPALLDTSGAYLEAVLSGPVMPNFIKPNAQELSALVGAPITGVADAGRHACELRAGRAIDLVAVSLGPDGAVLAAPDGCWYARPPAIRPVNTVGCGDSFVGAFAAAWAAGQVPGRALTQAVAVSAASAMYPGTGSFDPGTAVGLVEHVHLERLT